jgi:hypothetical protein
MSESQGGPAGDSVESPSDAGADGSDRDPPADGLSDESGEETVSSKDT